jgi:hypothetical protein
MSFSTFFLCSLPFAAFCLHFRTCGHIGHLTTITTICFLRHMSAEQPGPFLLTIYDLCMWHQHLQLLIHALA